MLENKEMMEEMGFEAEEIEELKQLVNNDKERCRWYPKVELFVECGKECKCVYGLLKKVIYRCDKKILVVWCYGKLCFVRADKIVIKKIWWKR